MTCEEKASARWETGDVEHAPWGKQVEIIEVGESTVCWIDCEGGDETRLNLVLAAPDLLAACKEVEQRLTSMWTPSTAHLDPHVALLRAVIAKAKGRDA